MPHEQHTTLTTVCGGRERDDASLDTPSVLQEMSGAILVLEPGMTLLPAAVLRDRPAIGTVLPSTDAARPPAEQAPSSQP